MNLNFETVRDFFLNNRVSFKDSLTFWEQQAATLRFYDETFSPRQTDLEEPKDESDVSPDVIKRVRHLRAQGATTLRFNQAIHAMEGARVLLSRGLCHRIRMYADEKQRNVPLEDSLALAPISHSVLLKIAVGRYTRSSLTLATDFELKGLGMRSPDIQKVRQFAREVPAPAVP